MAVLHRMELPEHPLDRADILRYAMQPRSASSPESLPLEEVLKACTGKMPCRAVWCEFPVAEHEESLDLGFAETKSGSLRRHLSGCDRVILFAVTAGVAMDQLIRRASLRSPVQGLLTHAVGAARVEQACDDLCAELAARFAPEKLTERFSPGYGDLPLSFQREVFRALDCGRTLELTLTDTCLMQPSKSVTALVGLRRESHVDS